MEMIKEQSKKERAVSAFVVMVCTLGTRILGFLKFAVINAYFGAAGAADVLNAVFSIPNNLRKLMAEGALTTAFIPELNKNLALGQKERARRLTQNIMGFQYAVLLPFIAASSILAVYTIRLFVHFDSPEKMALAAQLYRLFIPYVLLVSVSAVLMAALNSHNKFLAGALSPLVFSVCIIAAIVFLASRIGVYSMAVGVLAGGLTQVAVQSGAFRKAGYTLRPAFDFKEPSFRYVLRKWAPALATSSVFAVNQQISMLLATGLQDGSSSALANAIVFFQLPYGIFSASVNTVYYPQMSRCAKTDNYAGLQESLTSGLKLLLLFLAPAALLMSLMAEPIIGLAFIRGAFYADNAIMAAQALTGFCMGMFFTAAYNFMQRYFYAKGVFRAPLYSAVLACALDVVLSLALIKTSLGVSGLAYANSIAFLVCFAVLCLLAKMRFGLNGLGVLWAFAAKTAAACLMGFAVFALLKARFGFGWWQNGLSLRSFGLLALFGLSSMAAVLLGYMLFIKNDFFNGLLRRKFSHEK